MSDPVDDDRVYVSLRGLTALEHRTSGLSFSPKQPVRSLLSGRHASRIRGRGLQFEEIRDYRPGDDVRTMDWKVTARTRRPHTRVFMEERDRPVMLVVDQRVGMFFGTQRYMKSVSAAHVGALVAWRVLGQGDRIGAIVFDDHKQTVVRPQRSRDCVTRILSEIVEFNRSLSADVTPSPGQPMLGDALEQASRIAQRDHLVVIVSDFVGLDAEATRSLRRMALRNDLVGVLIHDPSASDMPSSTRLVVSNGELQLELSGRTMKRVEQATSGRISNVLALQRTLRSPILPISTADEVLPQLHRLLGRG